MCSNGSISMVAGGIAIAALGVRASMASPPVGVTLVVVGVAMTVFGLIACCVDDEPSYRTYSASRGPRTYSTSTGPTVIVHDASYTPWYSGVPLFGSGYGGSLWRWGSTTPPVVYTSAASAYDARGGTGMHTRGVAPSFDSTGASHFTPGSGVRTPATSGGRSAAPAYHATSSTTTAAATGGSFVQVGGDRRR